VVTGGAGYVGSVLVPHLLNLGYRVHVIDNLRFGGESMLPNFIHPNFSFRQGDVLDRGPLAADLADASAVVHLAALVGYPICKKFPDEARRVNLDGARCVLESAPAEARFINFSTGSNYGEVAGICDEDTPLNPLSLYGETKTAAERLAMERPNSVALRFATAFGLSPRLRLDLMINDFCYQALVNRYLLVYERRFRRTFIHVHDMARVVPHLLANWNAARDRVYNVGHESMNFTKEDITGLLRNKLDFHLYFADVGSDDDKRDYEVSYARIRGIGFHTAVDIDRGLDELIGGLRLVRIRNPYSNV
jgi:nucleoside-diphosphate-sugar epimerase